MKTFIKSGLIAALLGISATAGADVSANLGFASEYYYRGIFQKNSSASAGLDYESGGFYVGTWAADVGDGMEVDVYGGYGADVGDVNLSVEGEQEGATVTYEYAQLLPEDTDKNWPFSFRYFQDFDREIVLPDGFTPERITIEVRSRTRSISSIEESYSWTTSPG